MDPVGNNHALKTVVLRDASKTFRKIFEHFFFRSHSKKYLGGFFCSVFELKEKQNLSKVFEWIVVSAWS